MHLWKFYDACRDEDESGADREKGAKQLKRRKYETAKTTQSAVHEGGGTYNHRYTDGVNRC